LELVDPPVAPAVQDRDTDPIGASPVDPLAAVGVYLVYLAPPEAADLFPVPDPFLFTSLTHDLLEIETQLQIHYHKVHIQFHVQIQLQIQFPSLPFESHNPARIRIQFL